MIQPNRYSGGDATEPAAVDRRAIEQANNKIRRVSQWAQRGFFAGAIVLGLAAGHDIAEHGLLSVPGTLAAEAAVVGAAFVGRGLAEQRSVGLIRTYADDSGVNYPTARFSVIGERTSHVEHVLRIAGTTAFNVNAFVAASGANAFERSPAAGVAAMAAAALVHLVGNETVFGDQFAQHLNKIDKLAGAAVAA